MKDRKFTPPFLIQMSSGDKNKQCDLLPHGSFHEVKQDEEGFLWLTDRIDSIPNDFAIKKINEKPEAKKCPSCSNEFPKDWPFAHWTENLQPFESCIRCYERKNIGHKNGFSRDDYRQAIREEIKKELKLL